MIDTTYITAHFGISSDIRYFPDEKGNKKRLHKYMSKIESDIHRGIFFRTFIPLKTMGVVEGLLTTIIPNTSIYAEKKWQASCGAPPPDKPNLAKESRFWYVAYIIADIITLPFRILTLIPRIIYQSLQNKKINQKLDACSPYNQIFLPTSLDLNFYALDDRIRISTNSFTKDEYEQFRYSDKDLDIELKPMKYELSFLR